MLIGNFYTNWYTYFLGMSWDDQHASKVDVLLSWQVRIIGEADRGVHRANPIPMIPFVILPSATCQWRSVRRAARPARCSNPFRRHIYGFTMPRTSHAG